MAKVCIEFDTLEEPDAHMRALKGSAALQCLHEMDQELRHIAKHSDNVLEAEQAERWRRCLRQLIVDYDLQELVP